MVADNINIANFEFNASISPDQKPPAETGGFRNN